MDLRLVDLRRGPADDRWWTPPFDEAVTYEHPDWWNPHNFDTEDPWYVQVLDHGVEVARVELKEDVDIEHYANVPAVGAERLEVAFIEVATAECGRGVGTRVVRELELRHPGRRLLAYSAEADGFWAGLGWDPFQHPEGDWRTLFIRPEVRRAAVRAGLRGQAASGTQGSRRSDDAPKCVGGRQYRHVP